MRQSTAAALRRLHRARVKPMIATCFKHFTYHGDDPPAWLREVGFTAADSFSEARPAVEAIR